ncbi:ATP-binding protein [Halobacteria archaeon AArc-m2/3/4]|uniref:histidine kinase n=1 Tax=Natronoglomus mannanivorans TaxID=2979990 RepID=A0ABT2QLC4_9EURY|nr:ATP-binding protein [Halobacteria archaeon AArc-m2/3/4]
MDHTALLYSGLEAVFAIVTVAITVLSWRYRSRVTGFPLFVTAVSAAAYALASFTMPFVSDPLAWQLVNNIRYPLGALIATGSFFIAVEFTQNEQYNRPVVRAAFGLILAVDAIVALTNPIHRLMITDQFITETGIYAAVLGPLFWVHVVVGLAIGSISIGLLLDNLREAQGIYRTQNVVLVVGLAMLAVFFGIQSVAAVNYRFDLATVGIVGYCSLILWGLFRADLLQTVPVSRETLLKSMDDPVIALDENDTVVDLNTAAMGLFSVDAAAIGNHVESVFADYPALKTRVTAAELETETRDEITLSRNGNSQYFDLLVSPIVPRETHGPTIDATLGRIVVLRDITDRKQYETRIETHNRTLERLANVISHDLRSPMATAQNLVTILKLNLDEPNESAERSIAELEALIGDIEAFASHLPALARESSYVEHPTTFDLEPIADAAWRAVDTDGLSLQVVDEITLSGDPRRLRQVLQNLFQNTAHHARPTATTVTVGLLPDRDGFFVEDDGPGIGAAQDDEIFDYGMSTGDGTGIGLAIVRTIVEAHSWRIAVTHSDRGGARFEIDTNPT